MCFQSSLPEKGAARQSFEATRTEYYSAEFAVAAIYLYPASSALEKWQLWWVRGVYERGPARVAAGQLHKTAVGGEVGRSAHGRGNPRRPYWRCLYNNVYLVQVIQMLMFRAWAQNVPLWAEQTRCWNVVKNSWVHRMITKEKQTIHTI